MSVTDTHAHCEACNKRFRKNTLEQKYCNATCSIAARHIDAAKAATRETVRDILGILYALEQDILKLKRRHPHDEHLDAQILGVTKARVHIRRGFSKVLYS